jgi:ATP-binding cassette subfamily C (CFTR/MRP) protein 4
VCLLLLWQEVGVSSLAGFAAVVLCVPLQRFVGHKFGVYRRKAATASDDRIRVTGQLLQGAQQLKMAAWEIPFRDYIAKLRTKEVMNSIV